MLKKLEVVGYKSINNLTLDLEGFNLLAGVNSAGKSSIIQCVSIAWQAMQSRLQGGDQIRLNYGRFSDMRNSIKGNKTIDINLYTETDDEPNGQFNMSLYTEEGENKYDVWSDEQENWKQYVENNQMVYLSTERVGVRNSYMVNTENSYAIGNEGEYAYAYLALHGQEAIVENNFAYNPEAIGLSLNNQVNYWLSYLVGFRVQVNTVPDLDQVVVTFANERDMRFYRAKNVGTGLSFVAMLLIAALSCRKGDTLMIENPEIHLHPRAQSRFMECMAFLTERGLQIIMETHSDHIYNGMRKCIKSRKLSKERIAAYYLELDDSMQTEATGISFNDEGAEQNHPYGMFDQFDDDLDELLGI